MFREEQTYVLFKDANTNSIFTMRHSVVLIVMFGCDKQYNKINMEARA